MKLSLIQLKNLQNNDANLKHALEMIDKAAAEGTDFIALPEMFSCPYQTSKFPVYAQEDKGPNWQKLSAAAKKNHIYLCTGSMPELEIDRSCCEHVERIYNTSYVFNRDGLQIAKHRKVHLFDVDIKGGQHFKESDSLSPGNQITTFETEFGTFGLMICFDIRFPEMAGIMQQKGARLILVPAAFNMTSGPKWWELMFRSRAVDNQLFMAGISPARDEKASYVAWGQTLAVDPWGTVIDSLETEEGILTVNIDFSKVDEVRAQVPLISAKRTDLYHLTSTDSLL